MGLYDISLKKSLLFGKWTRNDI